MLIQSNNNLWQLSRPFTIEETDNVIKQMPADKAPGPDGFNGYFIKSCRETIKIYFYSLCFDFFNETLDLQSINNSFITLIPKTNNPTTVNDFRPISLLNYVLKIITKLLANRLQGKTTSLIHNQPVRLHQEQDNSGLLSMDLWVYSSMSAIQERNHYSQARLHKSFWYYWA